MLYMCIEYHMWVNMYHVSAQGVDERMTNVHYYYLLQSNNNNHFVSSNISKFDPQLSKAQHQFGTATTAYMTTKSSKGHKQFMKQ